MLSIEKSDEFFQFSGEPQGPVETASQMKPKIIIAILLIVLGIAAFAYQGITYTTRERVVDIGSIHMTAEKTRKFPLPPIVGVIALVGGILVLVLGSKKDG